MSARGGGVKRLSSGGTMCEKAQGDNKLNTFKKR